MTCITVKTVFENYVRVGHLVELLGYRFGVLLDSGVGAVLQGVFFRNVPVERLAIRRLFIGFDMYKCEVYNLW